MMSLPDLAKNIKIFHGMTPQQVGKVASHLRAMSYSKGDWVVEENIPATGLYIIRRGTAQVWKGMKKGHEKFCLGQMDEGDCFGEMAMIDCQKRSASVIAVTGLKLYFLPVEAMFKIYQQDPRLYGLFLLNIAREISRRLRKTDRTLVEFALAS